MTNDIAINGYGRIGPNVPCAFMKAGRVHDIEIVAINDLGDAETNARLMRYDTAHERCAGSVAVDDDQLVANGDRLEVFADRNPSFVPGGLLRVDFVLERTSRYTSNKIVSRTSCRRREKGRDLCAQRQGRRRDDRLRGFDRMLNTSKYGSGRKRLRYRLPVNSEPDVQQRLHNLTELARKLDVARRRADNKPSGALRCAARDPFRLQRNAVLGLLSQPAPWEQRIGVVTHYYSHLSVATMRLEPGTTLHVGDAVHIHGHTTDFTQKVESLEVDHTPVTEVGPNDDFGLKVIDHAREHDAVFRVRS